MLNTSATLEEDGTNVDSPAARPETTSTPGPGVMRFVYSTGSRPLDGFTIKLEADGSIFRGNDICSGIT